MWSKGQSGRGAAGTLAVVSKAALLLTIGMVCLATTQAEEPARLPTRGLPQFRLDMTQAAPGLGSVDARGFRPGRLPIDRSAGTSTRFYDTHLMPELEDRFTGMAQVYQNMPWAGSELERFTMRGEVTDSARKGLERATARALRDFVLEWSQIEEKLLSIPLSKKISSASPGIGSEINRRRHQDLDFSFGISSMMPEVGVKYRLSEMETRVEIDGHGSVDLSFSRSADVYTRIAVTYDGEEHGYGLYYRARF